MLAYAFGTNSLSLTTLDEYEKLPVVPSGFVVFDNDSRHLSAEYGHEDPELSTSKPQSLPLLIVHGRLRSRLAHF
jgi:hypothetical protein